MKKSAEMKKYDDKKRQNRHKFTPEEDDLIRKCVQEIGREWKTIADRIPGLNSRQCRERYVFYLDPNISNKEWTEQDENKLVFLVNELGNCWVKIAAFFPNQSVINVKNQYQKILRHQKRKLRKLKKEADKLKQSQDKESILYSFDNLIPEWDSIPVDPIQDFECYF